MVQVKKEQKQIQIEWSDEEMEQFDKEIEPYRIEIINSKTSKSFKYFSIGAEFKYLEDKGIIKVRWNKDWQLVRGMSEIEMIICKGKEKQYQGFEHKLGFYFDWEIRKELGNLGL